MRLSKQFFFSVEGETELWYFQWLSRSINTSDEYKEERGIRAFSKM
jgi:hypothetical protein